MGAKVASLLILVTSLLLSLSAQAQQWGYGMYGGSQPCGYNQMSGLNQAPATPPEDSRLLALKKEQAELRKEKQEDARSVRELERRRTKYTDSISEVMTGDWAQAVTEHLDHGYNCNCPDPTSSPEIQPATPEDSPRRARPHPRVSQTKDLKKAGRLPASEDDSTLTDADASRGNPYDKKWFGGNPGAGQHSDGNCAPPDDLHNSQPWHLVCINGGSVTKAVCHNHYFAKPGVTGEGLRNCDDALEHYAKVNGEIEKLNRDISKAEDSIASLSQQIRERSREVSREKKYAGTHNSDQGSGISWLPLVAGLVAGGAVEYLGYHNNQANNDILSRAGYPTNPYQFGAGIPFFQAGLYGSVASGQGGAYGCSGGFNPGFPGLAGFGQQGVFQNYNPNYQASLYGGGYPLGYRYPGYLGLGQSLTPVPTYGTTSVYTGGR